MRIGLFGGTFDPLHFGHLHLAGQMQKIHSLDEVWFIPASVSPHKLDHPPAPAEHRLEMVKLGTAHNPAFRVLDLEVKRGGSSYTIDTIREILATEKGEFCLLISDDMVAGLPRWREISGLIDCIPILVGQRMFAGPPETGEAKIDAAVKKGFTSMPILKVTATEIRKRLRGNVSCEGLAPPEVLSYISKNQLYSA